MIFKVAQIDNQNNVVNVILVDDKDGDPVQWAVRNLGGTWVLSDGTAGIGKRFDFLSNKFNPNPNEVVVTDAEISEGTSMVTSVDEALGVMSADELASQEGFLTKLLNKIKTLMGK